MPCQSWTPEEEWAWEQAENKKKFGLELSTVSLTTRIACELGTLLRDKHPELFADLPQYTRAFLEHHWLDDENRKRRQEEQVQAHRLRRRAINKLTPEERRALGVSHD